MLNKFESTARIIERYDALIQQTADGTMRPKGEYLRLLVLLRAMIRAALDLKNKAKSELRYYRRQEKLLKQQGVSFILLDAAIRKNADAVQNVEQLLIAYGRSAEILFNCWEAAGAVPAELFNLCGSHRMKGWKKEKLTLEQERSFSRMIFVYNLDYHDDGLEWLSEDTDAPFTHAMKEYMLDQMTNTEEGRAAAHKALEEVFPELLENAMTLTTDAEGNRVLIDKNGEIVGYPKEE